jgi:two-component system response regulator PilR (NtrC family)
MFPVLRKAWKAARANDATLLIEGETGTGKQIFAQAIHRLDQKRGPFPFVTVHAATIQENLAESELFGHQKGSFSGANNDRKGLFRAAHRGTLFLDDVSDLPAPIQTKLLDVLQRAVVRPVGCDHEVPVDVRIIAASNRPLEVLVRENGFRLDLYHRLNVIHLQLPPLRERSGDLPALMIALAQRNESLYKVIDQVDPRLAEYLASRHFEGNIRQLEHAVRRMLLDKESGHSLDLADWLAQDEQGTGSLQSGESTAEAARLLWAPIRSGQITYASAFESLERSLLQTALSQTEKTRRQIAAELGMSERTLYQKLSDHGLAGKVGPRSAGSRSPSAEFTSVPKTKTA